MLLQAHSAPLTDSCPPFFDSRQSSSAGRRTECKVFSKTRTKGAAAPEEGAGAGGGGAPFLLCLQTEVWDVMGMQQLSWWFLIFHSSPREIWEDVFSFLKL